MSLAVRISTYLCTSVNTCECQREETLTSSRGALYMETCANIPSSSIALYLAKEHALWLFNVQWQDEDPWVSATVSHWRQCCSTNDHSLAERNEVAINTLLPVQHSSVKTQDACLAAKSIQF
ncbi:uncharacterized protein LOC135374598 [Ornithodoros turicata]|uniref:uncharacterized protein LOC135374598 n=1 Tax=Ornithodoros turicata TaxID=34597 RepID=UPI003138CDB7